MYLVFPAILNNKGNTLGVSLIEPAVLVTKRAKKEHSSRSVLLSMGYKKDTFGSFAYEFELS
jgi:hypothetical protein